MQWILWRPNIKSSSYPSILSPYKIIKEDDPKRCDYQSEQAYERFVAYTYIQGTDKNRSGKLEEDLANHYALGQDMYPTDLASATSMVMNYMNKINNPNHPSMKEKDQKKDSRRLDLPRASSRKIGAR